MENEFVNYRAFDSIETARFVLLDMLEANGIPFSVYKDAYRQDVILGRGMDLVDVWVRLRPEDFDKVNELMLHDAEERFAEVPQDYYLREMETTELLNVLKQPDMWSFDDFVVARKLLEERGIPVSPDKIEAWADERQNELDSEKWGNRQDLGKGNKNNTMVKGPGDNSGQVLDYETDKSVKSVRIGGNQSRIPVLIAIFAFVFWVIAKIVRILYYN